MIESNKKEWFDLLGDIDLEIKNRGCSFTTSTIIDNYYRFKRIKLCSNYIIEEIVKLYENRLDKFLL